MDPKTLAGLQTMIDAAYDAGRTAAFAQSLAASSAVARAIEQASVFEVPALPTFDIPVSDSLGAGVARLIDEQAASTARLLDAVGPVIDQARLGLDFENVLGPLRAATDTIAALNLDEIAAPLEAMWSRWDERLRELAPKSVASLPISQNAAGTRTSRCRGGTRNSFDWLTQPTALGLMHTSPIWLRPASTSWSRRCRWIFLRERPRSRKRDERTPMGSLTYPCWRRCRWRTESLRKSSVFRHSGRTTESRGRPPLWKNASARLDLARRPIGCSSIFFR